MFSCRMISRPMSTPMTEAIISPRVQPDESPRQWRRRMFVLRSASVFTRLKQNFRSGEQSSVSYETKPGTTGSRFNERFFFASYALDQRPERNAPAADKGCRDSAQEGEKDSTAKAEPSFRSEIRQACCYPFFPAITSVISAAPRDAPFPAVFGTPPETDPDRPC